MIYKTDRHRKQTWLVIKRERGGKGQMRSPALRFHGDLIQLMAETCRGFILTCQCQEAPNDSFGNRPEMGKACGPNSPFSVKLFGLSDHFITRNTNLNYWIIDFQGTYDLYCYCVLWLRSQTWIGSQERA